MDISQILEDLDCFYSAYEGKIPTLKLIKDIQTNDAIEREEKKFPIFKLIREFQTYQDPITLDDIVNNTGKTYNRRKNTLHDSKPILSISREFVDNQPPKISGQDIKASLSKIGDRQKLLLTTVYLKLKESNRNKVRLSWSKWFKKEMIDSDSVNWSNALTKLINRKLIIKSFQDPNSSSKNNSGNSISYLSLTPLGYEAAKYLINRK